MNKKQVQILDGILTFSILILNFFLNVFLQELFGTRSLIPMNFVLGVFVISVKTQGYFWGITASLVSVLAVNYAFTYPYYAIDLISPECVTSAIVMLFVAITTGTMTTKLKYQEKIKAESDKERMRANLLRAVSHDLRTPLTSIYGCSSVIIENYDSISKEHQLELLKGICDDAGWLIRMVENLLSITRIDGDKVKVAKVSTSLEELIDIVLVKFKKIHPDQKVIVNLPEELVFIPMDPMLIEQVLINLLENAVDHAIGMTQLELKVICKDKKAMFTVSDDGCGIVQDRLKGLFTGNLEHKIGSPDRIRKNLGIGLSVCAAIIKAHGSEIYAANRENGGAIFSFSLEMEDENE